jgi:hypothetical protein
MKLLKLFLMFLFNLLLSANIFGQAAVDIPLSATDGTFTHEFFVGLDLTATNCIDTLLGECVGEPPLPPPGVFDIRLNLPPDCGQVFACKDYRPPGNPPAFPFTGTIEHTLWFQMSSLGIPLNINYNLPEAVQMLITDPFGGTFLNLGPFTGQGVTTIPGTYTTIFSKVLLVMEYDNIIPVELTSFSASVLQNEKVVQLNWTTATEINNLRFEILRFAQNDNEWKTIGFVPGFGTTTEQKTYSFIDENVSTGNYKYRLKQIDFDGSFEYSNEIEVEVDFTPEEFVLYQNYPNPFNPSTLIEFTLPDDVSNATLSTYNALGMKVTELVNRSLTAGKYSYQFNSIDLSTGFYIYELRADNFISAKKMLLLK